MDIGADGAVTRTNAVAPGPEVCGTGDAPSASAARGRRERIVREAVRILRTPGPVAWTDAARRAPECGPVIIGPEGEFTGEDHECQIVLTSWARNAGLAEHERGITRVTTGNDGLIVRYDIGDGAQWAASAQWELDEARERENWNALSLVHERAVRALVEWALQVVERTSGQEGYWRRTWGDADSRACAAMTPAPQFPLEEAMAVVLAQAVVDALIAWDGRTGARSPKGTGADEADSARGVEWALSVEALASAIAAGAADREEDDRLRGSMGGAASKSATRLLRMIDGARRRSDGPRIVRVDAAPTGHPVINWALREWASAGCC